MCSVYAEERRDGKKTGRPTHSAEVFYFGAWIRFTTRKNSAPPRHASEERRDGKKTGRPAHSAEVFYFGAWIRFTIQKTSAPQRYEKEIYCDDETSQIRA